MSKQNYKTMTDDELRKFMVDDPDAYYEFYLRHRDVRTIGAAKNCRNRTDDMDYYGSAEVNNR